MRKKELAYTALRIFGAAIFTFATMATAQTFQLLHDFTGTDGGYPAGNLIADSAGNLYGTTLSGGLQNRSGCLQDSPLFEGYCGTVFELSKNSSGVWSTTVLYEFTGGSDGSNPYAGLVMDKAGNLYGTAAFGGNCPFLYGCGVVFKLSPTSSGPWTETVLYSFQGSNDGSAPESQLVFDSAGNLYGTALGGGNGSCGLGVPCGVVFELTPATSGAWTETVLYNFQGFSDGAEPTGTVAFDSQGNLYGTTSIGGSSAPPCGYPFFGCGTIYELSPGSSGWTKTIVHTFTGGQDGAAPTAGVVLDRAGNVYGTTNLGGVHNFCGSRNGCGIVYSLHRNSSGGWTENVLKTFQPGTSGGQRPVGNVSLDSAGNLYGTANNGKLPGGAEGAGVVFKLSRSGSGWRETVLHTFSSASASVSQGEAPDSTLLLDSADNLFGTTSSGGTQNQDACGGYCGVVFEVVP